jgi:hypothetical protein
VAFSHYWASYWGVCAIIIVSCAETMLGNDRESSFSTYSPYLNCAILVLLHICNTKVTFFGSLYHTKPYAELLLIIHCLKTSCFVGEEYISINSKLAPLRFLEGGAL